MLNGQQIYTIRSGLTENEQKTEKVLANAPRQYRAREAAGDTTLTSGSWTTILFTDIISDIGGFTDALIIPSTGLYIASARITVTDFTLATKIGIKLEKTGGDIVAIGQQRVATGAGVENSVGCSAIFYATRGDEYVLSGYQNEGSDQDLEADGKSGLEIVRIAN